MKTNSQTTWVSEDTEKCAILLLFGIINETVFSNWTCVSIYWHIVGPVVASNLKISDKLRTTGLCVYIIHAVNKKVFD
jgi:hypothetical protein